MLVLVPGVVFGSVPALAVVLVLAAVLALDHVLPVDLPAVH